MHPIIAICQALSCIYRFGWIFCFILALGCGSESSCDNHKKTPQAGKQNPLGSQALLPECNTLQQSNKRKRADAQSLDELDDAEPPIKKMKWVAKVPEDKQVIVLLHGLSRHSGDFAKMMKRLEKKFPCAKIIPLTSVEKNTKSLEKTSAPSMKLSIFDQAKKTYEEIVSKVSGDSCIIMVCHSQGGLRGFTCDKEYGSRLKNEYGITIEGLITIGTPWKGAPIFNHIKSVELFNKKFGKIEGYLDTIQPGYGNAVRGYFFKKAPELAKRYPKLYRKLVPWVMKWVDAQGALDLDPESGFIRHYIASNLEKSDLPITAIAGVLTDFSKLFDRFSSSISKQALEELNATYAELIGGNPNCKHDMLLPVATQHAEGLKTKNFKRITVEGACHGNKVGIAVKRGLSEINNDKVIQEVEQAIKATFYEQQAEKLVDKQEKAVAAAA